MILYIPQQLIYFNKNGWWGISSYLETDLSLVSEVMDPLVLIPGSQHLITFVDKQGKYFWPEPIPPQGNLTTWNPVGYKLKVKNTPACLPIYGDSLVDQSFVVDGSFTFLPVLTNVPVVVDSLLQGHTDKIMLIYHWAKNQLWTPVASDFDTIYPGYAYLLVNKPGSGTYTIEYPHFVPDAPHLYPVQVEGKIANNSPWEDVQNTAQPHIFLFSDNATGKLVPGDIVGAFDQTGACFGMAEFNSKNDLYKLVAMGYSGYSSEDRGFLSGETINFRIYRPTTGEEFEVSFIYDSNYPSSNGLFASNSVSMVLDFTESATLVNNPQSEGYQLNIYPNPATDGLNIISNQKIAEIQILNSMGQVVYQTHLNDNAALVDVSKLPRGFYIVAVKQINDKITIRRVSIQ